MKSYLFCIFVTFFAAVRGAPPGHTVYDQKQTGDYNIQVHLKDIQIIAVLGDEALGDYDYNYDYSDFTIKPSGSNVTLRPPPEDINVTTASPKPETPSTTSEKPTEVTTAKPKPEKTTEGTVPSSSSSPDRIKVQILEDSSQNVGIIPADDLGLGNTSPLGEVIHFRRCASGYTRDKKGRCRRVRRPGHQHQFDIGRLASTLAAKFRLSEDDISSTLKTEEH